MYLQMNNHQNLKTHGSLSGSPPGRMWLETHQKEVFSKHQTTSDECFCYGGVAALISAPSELLTFSIRLSPSIPYRGEEAHFSHLYVILFFWSLLWHDYRWVCKYGARNWELHILAQLLFVTTTDRSSTLRCCSWRSDWLFHLLLSTTITPEQDAQIISQTSSSIGLRCLCLKLLKS